MSRNHPTGQETLEDAIARIKARGAASCLIVTTAEGLRIETVSPKPTRRDRRRNRRSAAMNRRTR